MSITFDKKNKIFNISTPDTTYLCGLYEDKFLVHIYYGRKITSTFRIEDVYKYELKAFSPNVVCGGEELVSDDLLQAEYPCYGSADLRKPAFHARYKDGSTVTKLEYKGHKITKGKPKLAGLPSAYIEQTDEADTLEIELYDSLTGLSIILMYTAYNTCDIITRSVRAVNGGGGDIEILKIMSMNLDMFDSEYDFVHLSGAWARERHINSAPLFAGNQNIDSARGMSSHYHNPFFALARKNADEFSGGVYGFGLVYSGNFTGGVEVNPWGTSRAYLGINDFNFRWILKPGEEFQTPEVIMTYSDNGFNRMSQTFHKLIRKRLCRGKYRDSERPVLINNWEATYFDFDEEKILNIAKTAKELGVELMVLDDGWFGKRNSDNCSLGDWYPDKNKLPDGIGGLAKKINALGMKFGLWFEPEMASPDSDLYRAHPDWILHTKNREPSQGRHQYILDLSRSDVCDYIIEFMSNILENNPIAYVKWDMNRSMSEAGSALLAAERQQETAHRYMLGLYHILETLTTKFPDVLFEGCSGGGGRFDLGMFYYYPQFWTSDNTDAVERMYIQYGTSMLYPSSVMGAHVSAVPNHQLSRTTPIKTRGDIAMLGRFGYELDLAKLSDEEKEIVKEQIKNYKKWGQIIHNADMYRLMSPFDSNYFGMEFLSDDKRYVIVVFASIMGKPEAKFEKLYLQGLDNSASYKNIDTGVQYGGDVLSNIGISMKNKGDFTSEVMIFERQ